MPPKTNKSTIKRNSNEFKECLDILSNSLVDIVSQTTNFQFKCEFLAKLNLYELMDQNHLDLNKQEIIKGKIRNSINNLIDRKQSDQRVKIEDDNEFDNLDTALEPYNGDNDELLNDNCMQFKEERNLNESFESPNDYHFTTPASTVSMKSEEEIDDFDQLANVNVESFNYNLNNKVDF
jgi:hypothetical protein